MNIASVGCALPQYRYEQPALVAAFTEYWAQHHHNTQRLADLHQAVQVGGRNLALPIEAYSSLTLAGANSAFIQVGLEIGEAAIRSALDQAGLQPTDVDAIFTTTVTGIATPSLDARLCNRLGFRSDIKRVPMFGLGCVAGAAGISRLHDYLLAFPDQVALLLSVELCSLTLQRADASIANLIATGLFGDGAACVVGLGDRRSSGTPSVLATRSRFYPDTERVMGWDITDSGMQIVLASSVPDMVNEHLREDVRTFLSLHDLSIEDITSWVCHPGGPKVLQAMETTLGLDKDALAVTWHSLEQVGNLSSASVLFVLRDTLAEHRPPAGSIGVMLAMGPGFCTEMVLLQW